MVGCPCQRGHMDKYWAWAIDERPNVHIIRPLSIMIYRGFHSWSPVAGVLRPHFISLSMPFLIFTFKKPVRELTWIVPDTHIRVYKDNVSSTR